MSAATLDQTLEMAMQLPFEQQEMLLEILQRRRIERSRRMMAADAQASIAEWRADYRVAQPAEEVIAELHRLLDE